MSGNLLGTYEYDADGKFVGQTDPEAIYTYYTDTGRMHTKELLVADDKGTPETTDDDPIGTIFTYSNDALVHLDGGTYGYLTLQDNPDGTYKTANSGADYVLQSIENFSGTLLPTIGIMIKL